MQRAAPRLSKQSDGRSNVSDTQNDEILNLISNGFKVEAIKQYKQLHQVDLEDAVKAISDMEQKYR